MNYADIVNEDYPVIGLKVYPSGDAEVIRGQAITALRRRKVPQQKTEPQRGKIKELSLRSRLRLAFTVSVTSVRLKSLLTLTYGHKVPTNGKDCKGHLNAILTALRRWYRKSGEKISYVWFLEFQKRGAPHYHILMSERPDDKVRKFVADTWSRLVGEGGEDTEHVRWQHMRRRTWENVRHQEGAKRYCLKYALKPYQKEVPEAYQDVGRFWGASRDVKECKGEAKVYELTNDELRRYLWGIDHAAKKCDVIPKLLFGVK